MVGSLVRVLYICSDFFHKWKRTTHVLLSRHLLLLHANRKWVWLNFAVSMVIINSLSLDWEMARATEPTKRECIL